MTILFPQEIVRCSLGRNLQPLQIHLQPIRMNLLPFQFEGQPFEKSLPAVGASEEGMAFAGTTFVLVEFNAMQFF